MIKLKDINPDDLIDGVEAYEVARYSALVGVRRALDALHGEGEWGVKEVATYIHLNRKKSDKPKVNNRIKFVVEKSYDLRYQEYLVAYDRLTPNDEQSLRSLVMFEMQIAEIQQKLMYPMDDAIAYKTLSATMTDMSKEHRLLQESLGIGRSKRKSDVNTADEIGRLVDGAKARVEKMGYPLIRCPNCDAKTVIDMGMLIFHFHLEQPWLFQSVCPKCDVVFVLKGKVELSPEAKF